MDDPADALRQEEGTLLPLWAFPPPPDPRRCGAAAPGAAAAVTALAWSPAHFDLFAVGYGGFDFLRPVPGAVAVFSLKSPARPEHTFPLEAGERGGAGGAGGGWLQRCRSSLCC